MLIVESDRSSAAIVGMKLPANVGVVKSSSMKIGWLHWGPGSETLKKHSSAPGRFAMGISEIKRAVLR